MNVKGVDKVSVPHYFFWSNDSFGRTIIGQFNVEGQLFKGGILVFTAGIMDILEKTVEEEDPLLFNLLVRHMTGDWGELDPHDEQVNQEALEHGFRLLSSYKTDYGKVWIITEAGRHETVVLTPGEY